MNTSHTPDHDTRPALLRPRVLLTVQVAWITFLLLPTIVGVLWQLWPRPGRSVRLIGFNVNGGWKFALVAILVLLAPTVLALAFRGVRRVTSSQS